MGRPAPGALLGGILIAIAVGGALVVAALPVVQPEPLAATPLPPRETRTAERILFPAAVALPGDPRRAVRSVLNIDRAMRYGEFAWDEARVPPGPVWVRIDLAAQTLSVFRGAHEIGTAVILYGADEKPTPLGHFPILARLKDHSSSLYDAPMPYTLRLTHDGVAIHGSDVRRGAATHGCIGVPTAFAAHLFDRVRVGSEVTIMAGDRAPRRT